MPNNPVAGPVPDPWLAAVNVTVPISVANDLDKMQGGGCVRVRTPPAGGQAVRTLAGGRRPPHLGLLRGRLDGAPCTVELHTDPTALLTDLGAGRFPAASGSALSTTAYPLTPTGPGRGASRS